MSKERLLAFTDGVIAVIITIMVLEIKAPHEANFRALGELVPAFLSYVLSFIYVAIYWTNHHHFFQTVERVTGGILWANLHLLFWLSLIPFATSWLDEHAVASAPTALYGVVLLMCALAWLVLQSSLVRLEARNAGLKQALGRDRKGKLSVVLYCAGIVLAFVDPRLGDLCYAFVALMWLMPDRRIVRHLSTE